MRFVLGTAAIALLFYAVFVHLDRFPRIFFDEGSYLKVAKNLAAEGLYAESGSEGPLYYGAPVAIGPTIYVSVAALFRLWRPGVVQGRLVIAAYLLGAVALFHALARHLGDGRLAAVATLLLLVTPALSLVPLGRQVMGEVPALFFVLGALLLWFRRWDRHTTLTLAVVGLLFGLGAVSKNQFALVLDLALALCAVLNATYYRLVPHRWFVIPLLVTAACHCLWTTLLLFAVVPAAGREEILAGLRVVAPVSTLVYPPFSHWTSALWHLLRPGAYFCLVVPALAYGATRARARTPREQQWSILLVVVLVNFAWHIAVTVGWARYAFLGLALTSLFVARLLVRASEGFRLRAAAPSAAQPALPRALGGALLLWVGVGVVLSAGRLLRDVTFPPPDDASAMAAYVDAHVPATAVIETWEPEMGFLSDRRYHFPPSHLMAKGIAYTGFGAPPPYEFYDPLQQSPPRYLLAGEYSIYTHGYRFEQVEREYRLLKRIGVYALWEREQTG